MFNLNKLVKELKDIDSLFTSEEVLFLNSMRSFMSDSLTFCTLENFIITNSCDKIDLFQRYVRLFIPFIPLQGMKGIVSIPGIIPKGVDYF